MALKLFTPKKTRKQRAEAMTNIDAIIRSHKKGKYQPKVVVKKLRKSVVKQNYNKQLTEKAPNRDSIFITSTPNCHKNLSAENSAINCISFPLEEDSGSSDSEPLINIIPLLNKTKVKPKGINYDDNDFTTVKVMNKKNTVEEAFSNPLKRSKRELISTNTKSSVGKENSIINNTENIFNGKENQRLEDSKTVNRKSPIKKNKITEKIADSATRLQNKSIEISFKQPLAALNENIQPAKTNNISKNGGRTNASKDNNKTLIENIEKMKVKQKINKLKEMKPDKNKSGNVEDKNLKVIKDSNNELLNSPHVSNIEPISNAENIITKNSTIPEKTVVQTVPPQDILRDVLFLPPLLKEKYKSLRASTSKTHSNKRKLSCGSELASLQTSICSFDSDCMIIGEMNTSEQSSQDLVHDMSLSVKPDWLKNIMKTTEEAAKKRKSEDTNEEYLLKKKKRKIMKHCSLSLIEKTRTDFNFFQKVATYPELQSLISKFNFEIYLHEQLNSIKNELVREDTKWKINMLVRRALLKDRDESK